MMPAPRRFGVVNWLGVWTLYRRELQRDLKEYRDTVLGPAISSLLFLAVFHLALASDGRPGGTVVAGVAFLEFLAPGLVILAVCQRAFEAAATWLVFDKLEGVIADMLMAPLTAAERTVGYAASAVSAGLISGAAVAIALLPFVDLPLRDPAAILFFAVAGALLHALLGLLVGLSASKWDHYSAWLTFLVIPFAFLSGIFYSVHQLPGFGQSLVMLNPVFYVIDGFRYGFIGLSDGPLATGVAIILAVDLLMAVAVYRLFVTGYKIKP